MKPLSARAFTTEAGESTNFLDPAQLGHSNCRSACLGLYSRAEAESQKECMNSSRKNHSRIKFTLSVTPLCSSKVTVVVESSRFVLIRYAGRVVEEPTR